MENHNIEPSAIESVHASMDSYPINAEVIVKDGVIVDEYYKEGYDENSVFTLQSTSKSITSALIGIAIDKGYIESVDVPLSTYFPQILESGSEYKNQLTIWHLLTHTTGLDASDTANWDEYDTVLIGYPIWWGIAAWPVDTFVKANDFNGKTVIPFCTSSSSGLGQSGELLAEEANGGNWLEGHRFRSNPSDSDIQDWTDSIQ